MPEYKIKDNVTGKIHVVRGADGTTREEALQYFQENFKPETIKQTKEKPYNPIDDMGALETMAAGGGKALYDLYRGAKQTLNIGDQDVLQREIDEAKKLDRNLSNSPAGMVGNIGATALATIPSLAIPGVNTVAGSALAGSALGGLMPTATGESTAENMLTGAVGGAAGTLAGRAIPKAISGIIKPFSKKGRDEIVKNVFSDFYGNNLDDLVSKVSTKTSKIPGYKGTLAELAEDPGIATLQKSVRNTPIGKEAIYGAEIRDNAARLSALSDIAKDDLTLSAAKYALKDKSGELYKKAGLNELLIDDELMNLVNNNTFKKAAKAVGVDIKSDKGLINAATGRKVPNSVKVSELHKVKIALDDMADFNPTTALDRFEKGNITQAKTSLRDYLKANSDDYAQAIENHIEQSRPINQMKIGQMLKDKLNPALIDDTLPVRERAQAFANTLKNEDELVRKTTGMRGLKLADIMEPEQIDVLKDVKDTLARKAVAGEMAAARGSDTAQNLISNQMMNDIVSPIGLPKFITDRLGAPLMRKSVEFAYKGPEEATQGILSDILANPELLDELLKRTTNGKLSKALTAMGDYSGRLGAAATLSAD